MDVIDLRSLITVISFLAFIGIVIWAYSSSRKSRFDEAAWLPFADDDMQQRTVSGNHADSKPMAETTGQDALKNNPEPQAGLETHHG